ncbi:trypsin [Boleophthalmus pectinirostris]|uniref:trypsin n=1 Tax=Boleophthalmus pectinirostris TaxID=150288 RepID=UPI00242EDA96|nr:trypsin [Boleophthalmus pectinirostris]
MPQDTMPSRYPLHTRGPPESPWKPKGQNGQTGQDDEIRIIGGVQPAPNSIKYIVSIQTRLRQHFCGGSLITKYWVLTAAHCNKGIDNMMVVAGDYTRGIYEGTEQEIFPQVLIPHPEYNSVTNNNDIMLIKLQVPVWLNNYISIIVLPRQDATRAPGSMCRVSGWGSTRPQGGSIPSVLQTVKLPIVSSEQCNSSMSYNGSITKHMICAGYSTGGKDACQGDSGGPLVCDGLLYGIVSWGIGCAMPTFPGVYTAVSNYRAWIEDAVFSFYRRCN